MLIIATFNIDVPGFHSIGFSLIKFEYLLTCLQDSSHMELLEYLTTTDDVTGEVTDTSKCKCNSGKNGLPC